MVLSFPPYFPGHKGPRTAGGSETHLRGAKQRTARRTASPVRLENTVPGDELANPVRLRAAVPQRNGQSVRRTGSDRRQAGHRVAAGLVHAQEDHR